MADLVLTDVEMPRLDGYALCMALKNDPATEGIPVIICSSLGEASDLERGFSGHGPHRDELAIVRDSRELRLYGSQGEQRLALLALLLAERAVVPAARHAHRARAGRAASPR